MTPRRKAWPWISGGLAILLLILTTLYYRDHVRESLFLRSDPNGILADPALRAIAMSLGRKVFTGHCATCHGTRGRGDRRLGAPDLTLGNYLYGAGHIDEIEQIVRYGIRSRNRRGADFASMPAFGTPNPYSRYHIATLSPAEIEELTQYLLGFTGRATDMKAAARGHVLFTDKGDCFDCHLVNATGDPLIGAPDLTDSVWLYGGSHDSVFHSIALGRAGFSPAYERILTPLQTRAVAAYIASLSHKEYSGENK